MEVKLQINYSEIDKEARQYVEYVGAKSEDGEYERILLQVEDKSLLDTLHDEMAASLNSMMMMWSKSDADTDNPSGRSIVYLLPQNAGVSIADTVAKEVKAFCVCYIVSRWFQIAGVEQTAAKAEEAAVHLKAIRDAMTRRVPPLRQRPPHIPTVVGHTTSNDAGVCVTVENEDGEDDTDVITTNG